MGDSRMPEDKIAAAAAYVLERWGTRHPRIGLVLGSGLGPIADRLEDPIAVDYADIPGFSHTTVPGHQGRLLCGRLSGRDVAVMQGRFHYYEGHAIADIAFPIRVLRKAGIADLILTNAAGGVNRSFRPGDLMLITDHIGLFCEPVLRGPNLDDLGPRFPDQSRVYDRELAALARASAAGSERPLREGVYVYCKGPQFETPAEIRLIAALGGDAVGMSTVPEAVAATHCGMRVLGISCITNAAAGILDQPLSHAEVLEAGRELSARAVQLVETVIGKMPAARG